MIYYKYAIASSNILYQWAQAFLTETMLLQFPKYIVHIIIIIIMNLYLLVNINKWIWRE